MRGEIQNPKVLIGDDSQILNNLLKDVFEDRGFDVVQALTGAECKAAFMRENPDIALVDLNMPQVDGIEVLRFIKNRDPEAVVVIMTGVGSEETAVLAMKLHADEYLTKPFDTRVVVDLASRLLERRAARKENIRLKKEIRRGEQYLAHLTTIINEALITTDAQGRVEFVNRAGQKMWGYSAEELEKEDVHFLIRGESRALLQRNIVRDTIEKGKVEGEFHFRKKDKGTFPGYLSTSVIKERDRVRGIVVVVADLTRLHEVEGRLRQSEKHAALGRVVEGVAHEVRNALTSLGGFANRLRKITADDPRCQTYSQIIVDDVNRLEAMVRQIEDYVRFSKFHNYDFQKVELVPLIEKGHERALASLPAGHAAAVSFQLDKDPKIPKISGDAGALEEIFYNLILNAYEAMPHGGKLTVTVEDRNSAVSVAIRDTGVGIPKEHFSEVFDPFFTGKMSGAGMGLSKVYLLVEEHRGTVKLTSEPNKGTIFEVLLPLERLALGAVPGEPIYGSGPVQ